MGISKSISKAMKDSSWIRAMFEEGEKMKKVYGPENILDFTLGNPITEPPDELKKQLVSILTSDSKGLHRYMTNSGFESVRTEIADYYRKKTGLSFSSGNIVMTVGAAGGLNVVFKSLLDPGNEVIVPNPFFVEFMFYIGNHGGVIKLVDSKDDFHLDIEKIKKAITKKTKAILINSPNNPTGVVYNEEELKSLAEVLRKKREQGQRIFLIADEAYKRLIYNGTVLPDVFRIYEDTIAVTCHSKDLGLAGERIGYIAASPQITNLGPLMDAMIFSNRILGFINAPALMQRVVGKFQNGNLDMSEYQRRRDAIYDILVESGFEVTKPQGAFYIFPKSPIPDDIKFVRELQKHHILGVPGIGFGKSGYFRLAYCVDMDVIERSRKYFNEFRK
ncbi:MAG TPA: pyridoxal phosphate-dependent aminotransferase [Syntrophorhabdaceae bacterium]|nr:pyridoxal phosphate-dependent aminotransferase [Syntrophorhabdaceae bacterium]